MCRLAFHFVFACKSISVPRVPVMSVPRVPICVCIPCDETFSTSSVPINLSIQQYIHFSIYLSRFRYTYRVSQKNLSKFSYFFRVFVSKVGITEFPENFTRGTPRPGGSEIKRIFNLGAQNGRYYYNSNSELLGELAFSRIFMLFHKFQIFWRPVNF